MKCNVTDIVSGNVFVLHSHILTFDIFIASFLPMKPFAGLRLIFNTIIVPYPLCKHSFKQVRKFNTRIQPHGSHYMQQMYACYDKQ